VERQSPVVLRPSERDGRRSVCPRSINRSKEIVRGGDVAAFPEFNGAAPLRANLVSRTGRPIPQSRPVRCSRSWAKSERRNIIVDMLEPYRMNQTEAAGAFLMIHWNTTPES